MTFFNYGIYGNLLANNSSNTGMCERYVNMADTADLITFMDRTLHGFDADYTGYYNTYITDGTHPTVEGQQIF